MPRLPLEAFCAELEAPMPSPAGGSAAAACAAMAASIVVMVGRGSPDWPEADAAATAAEKLRDELLVLGGADVEAVAALLTATRRERDGVEGAGEELRRARLRMAEVPLAIAEYAAEVMMLARRAARGGRRSMRPDAAAAASLAATAARVARSIVGVNLAGFADGDQPPEVARIRRAARAVSERIGGS